MHAYASQGATCTAGRYEDVMQTPASDLGVDVEELEMAWELCAEDGEPNFSPRAILSLVDDRFFKRCVCF